MRDSMDIHDSSEHQQLVKTTATVEHLLKHCKTSTDCSSQTAKLTSAGNDRDHQVTDADYSTW
jgi:hypothetical protein